MFSALWFHLPEKTPTDQRLVPCRYDGMAPGSEYNGGGNCHTFFSWHKSSPYWALLSEHSLQSFLVWADPLLQNWLTAPESFQLYIPLCGQALYRSLYRFRAPSLLLQGSLPYTSSSQHGNLLERHCVKFLSLNMACCHVPGKMTVPPS